MLASYSYLGFLNDPEVTQAACDAINQNGTGAHGVRLLAGTLQCHRQLENELASLMHSEDAVVFNSGFLTNLSTISTLTDSRDVVVGDELNHASISDGCKFSGASFESFRHNDMTHLEAILKQHIGHRILVIVDAVYSMDGDIAPIPDIVRLCKKYGALLMVDEAHSVGVIGATGRGVQEHFNLPDDAIDIKMGTLSKAIASCGGFIAARREIIDFLRHSARGYIFTAALPAPQVAAARKCLEILKRDTHRTLRLQTLAKSFANGLRRLGFQVPPTESAIVPIVFRTEKDTMEAVRFCRDRGLFVVPVLYPAVPMDAPRIRATVLSSFDDDDVSNALRVFEELSAFLHTDRNGTNR